jgi:hypothetical protein
MDRGRKAMPVQNKQCHERYVKKCQMMHKMKVRVEDVGGGGDVWCKFGGFGGRGDMRGHLWSVDGPISPT